MNLLLQFLTNESNVTIDVNSPVYNITIAPLGAKGDPGTFPIISNLPNLP